jgi:hypothetical protein
MTRAWRASCGRCARSCRRWRRQRTAGARPFPLPTTCGSTPRSTTAASARGALTAALANDRRHLALGRHLDSGRSSLLSVLEAGGESLLDLRPLHVDVLGLDYYCHPEWFYDDHRGQAPSPHPVGFEAIAQQFGERYGLPMMLTETNLRGLPSDRVTVLGIAPGGSRVETSFTRAWRDAASGAPVTDLPAYRLQSPNDRHLAGLLSSGAPWPWRTRRRTSRCRPSIFLPLMKGPRP